MLPQILATLSTISIIAFNGQFSSPWSDNPVLATHKMSLEKRYYPVQKENILLNLAYMNRKIGNIKDINWDEVKKPQTYAFRLNPNETFAFHDSILPEYTNVVQTTNSHFNSMEGFKSYGYLVGDGVCHLASLIYWTALDAGLKTEAPTNHNFMPIPEIDKIYGVSIYSNPNSRGDENQNLYITNNKVNPIEFSFDYDGDNLRVTVVEVN